MTEAEKRNIDNLKSRVGDLERQLEEAHDRLHEAVVATSDVKVGDVMMAGRAEYLVRVVDTTPLSGLCIVASPRKKDGTFGTRTTRLYSWQVAK